MGRLRPATRTQIEEAIPLSMIPTVENVIDNTRGFLRRYRYTATPQEVERALRVLRRRGQSRVPLPSYTARQHDAFLRFQRERKRKR